MCGRKANFVVTYLTLCCINRIQFQVNGLVTNGRDIILTKPITQRPLPYALSVTDLTYLALQEHNIYKTLVNYTRIIEEQQHVIQKYLQDYEESSLTIIEDLPMGYDFWEKANEIASNTLAAYRMVRRFANEFVDVQKYLNDKSENELLQKISEGSDVYGFPMEPDHNEAMEALLRLHYFYDLNIQEFASGNISGTQTRSSLNSQQTLEIAQYALGKEYFTLAMDWINATRSLLELENESCKTTRNKVEETNNDVVAAHDENFDDKWDKGHKYIFSEPIHQNKNSIPMKQVSQETYFGDRDPLDKSKAHYNCMSLCSGKNFQTEKEKAKLFCRHDTTSNPYWRINPLRKEILSINPDLIQIYDVIGEKWISYLIEKATPSLKRPPVAKGSRKSIRTATYAWLSDEDIPDAPLSRRIEFITGLNVRGDAASEYLQIAAYAFGGHVSPHTDSLPENDETVLVNGNRINTFLIYLNDVTKGGRTVFPALGTSVIPVKGSAVLWYTSHKNTDIDRRMLHAACPVIYGQKWIATKWTNLNVNFLKRPCSTNSME